MQVGGVCLAGMCDIAHYAEVAAPAILVSARLPGWGRREEWSGGVSVGKVIRGRVTCGASASGWYGERIA